MVGAWVGSWGSCVPIILYAARGINQLILWLRGKLLTESLDFFETKIFGGSLIVQPVFWLGQGLGVWASRNGQFWKLDWKKTIFACRTKLLQMKVSAVKRSGSLSKRVWNFVPGTRVANQTVEIPSFRIAGNRVLDIFTGLKSCASIAQLGEQRFCKPQVVGSSPSAGSFVCNGRINHRILLTRGVTEAVKRDRL